MSNINNNNFNGLKLKLNYDEYWDFFLNKDSYEPYYFNDSKIYDDCLISLIDVSLKDCVDGDTVKGTTMYNWDNSISLKYTLNNIGYTGFDNGLLYFRKDMIMNKDFIELYKNSQYTIEDDNLLKLHKVTGSTMTYEYPLYIEDDKIKLNGGFLQGFFKTECDKYQILPSYIEQGETWAYEFLIKRCEFEKETNKTLNDKYPNNKGIFFYIGTRAENKWIYLYNPNDNDKCFTLDIDDYVENTKIDVNTYKINNFIDVSIEFPNYWDETALDDYISYKYGTHDVFNHTNISTNKLDYAMSDYIVEDITDLISNCSNCEYVNSGTIFGEDYLLSDDSLFDGCEFDYVEGDIDISDFIYETDNGFIIGKYEEFLDTDNKFLLFDRTCNGFTVNNWTEGNTIRYINEKFYDTDNLFLLMNRTCSGNTVNTFSALRKKIATDYNVIADLYNNALAFRITDDGKIGYRYLVKDCESDSKYKILEGYSKPNMIEYDKWSVVHVKLTAYYDTMQLRFYVNGKLVFVTDTLPKLNLRALNDVYEKQETVPFNLSLGGGTQGLCDVILPNYMIEPYRVYPLEKNFAGTFIGYIKSFKIYTCDLEYLNILNNFKFEIDKMDIK